MKKLLALLALTSLTANSFAYIYQEPSVKGAALGSAYTAGSATDVFAASFNPASQTYARTNFGAAWHKRESAEQIYSLGFGYNFFNGIGLNAYANYLNDNRIDADNIEARLGASFSLIDMGVNFPLTLGLNLKQGWVDVNNVKENALVGDIGFIVRPLERLKLGGVYSNIGGKKGIYTEDTYSLGASYLLTPWAEHNFDLRMDLGKEGDESRFGLGVEYTYSWFALRLGYVDNNLYDTANFTYGIGYDFGRYGHLDAAYLPYDFDKTYKLSYSILFGNKYYVAEPKSKSYKSSGSTSANSTTGYNADATLNGRPYYGNGTVREVVYDTKQPYVNTGVAVAGPTASSVGTLTATNSAYPNTRPQRWMK